MRGLMSVALEEEEAIEQEVLAAQMPVTDSAAADVEAELEQDGAVVDRMAEQLDRAALTAMGVNSLSERVAETLPEGGLLPGEAEVVRVSLEGMLAVISYHNKDREKVLAFEGFEHPASRVEATNVVMESFTETITTIVKKIVEAFKRIIEYIRTSLAKVLPFFRNNKEKAERLVKLTAELKRQNKVIDTSVTLKNHAIANLWKIPNRDAELPEKDKVEMVKDFLGNGHIFKLVTTFTGACVEYSQDFTKTLSEYKDWKTGDENPNEVINFLTKRGQHTKKMLDSISSGAFNAVHVDKKDVGNDRVAQEVWANKIVTVSSVLAENGTERAIAIPVGFQNTVFFITYNELVKGKGTALYTCVLTNAGVVYGEPAKSDEVTKLSLDACAEISSVIAKTDDLDSLAKTLISTCQRFEDQTQKLGQEILGSTKAQIDPVSDILRSATREMRALASAGIMKLCSFQATSAARVLHHVELSLR